MLQTIDLIGQFNSYLFLDMFLGLRDPCSNPLIFYCLLNAFSIL